MPENLSDELMTDAAGFIDALPASVAGRPVLVIDFEDRPETFANRLLSLAAAR